jgi:hypothetical protein
VSGNTPRRSRGVFGSDARVARHSPTVNKTAGPARWRVVAWRVVRVLVPLGLLAGTVVVGFGAAIWALAAASVAAALGAGLAFRLSFRPSAAPSSAATWLAAGFVGAAVGAASSEILVIALAFITSMTAVLMARAGELSRRPGTV